MTDGSCRWSPAGGGAPRCSRSSRSPSTRRRSWWRCSPRIGGAAYSIAGVMLVLGRIETGDLVHGAIAALWGFPLAVAAWLIVAAIALAFQLQAARAGSMDLRARLNTPTT